MYFIRFVKYVKFAIVIIQRIAIFFFKKGNSYRNILTAKTMIT